MYVGCLIVDFHIPATASLKDKRSIVKSNIQRAQQRFNASIVELADHDLWRRATSVPQPRRRTRANRGPLRALLASSSRSSMGGSASCSR